jgi:ABC-type uncharacterized transport system permease subunit
MGAVDRINPVAAAIYFLAAAGIAMFSMDPVLLVLSFLGAAGLLGLLGGLRPLSSHLWALGLFAVSAVINPLTYHNGQTVLLVVSHNPITLEACIYGMTAAGMIISVLYWFFGTERGASIRATGANSNMARAQGINTNLNTVLGLVIANGLVALSGALLSQYQGFAESNMGRGAIVIGLAAIIIGEVTFGKLFRNFALKLLSVSLGSVIYFIVIQSVISLMDIDTNYLKLISAVIVAIFLALPYWKTKIFHNKVRKETKHA